MKLLSDELHDLADGITPKAATAARDRARRGIARHQRNRRAAISATGAVLAVVVAVTAFVAVDRDHGARRPAGTTVPAGSTTATAGTAPVTSLPTGPIAVTVPDHVAPATSAYRDVYPWGTGPGEVAFHTPAGEGAAGGPAAFTADGPGHIAMLDHSNARLVFDSADGSAFSRPVALASPAVTAAAFDPRGRVIVASLTDLAVFGPTGAAEGSWTGAARARVDRLEVDGTTVYAVAYSFTNQRTRIPLLRDRGSGYAPVPGAAPEPDPIVVDEVADLNRGVIRITAGGVEYRITTGLKDLRSVRLRPDGSLVFVVGMVQSGSGLPDRHDYVLSRIDRDGTAHYATVTASVGYLDGGPQFDITNDGVAVMGSTTTGGVTISYYRF